MDRKTFIQFMIISMIIMTAWYLLMGRHQAKKRDEVTPGQQETQEPVPPRTVEREVAPAPPREERTGQLVGAAERSPKSTAKLERGIPLGNQLIGTRWTNKGAGAEQVQLLNYKAPYYTEEDGKVRPVLSLLREIQDGYPSDVIEGVTFFRGPGQEEPDWSRDVRTDELVYEVVERSSDHIVFEGVLHPWLKVRKTVSIDPDSHHFDVDLAFTNLAEADIEFSYWVRGAAGLEREILQGSGLGTIVCTGQGNKNKVSNLTAPKIIKYEDRAKMAEMEGDFTKRGDALEELFDQSRNVKWAGAVGQYFVALTQPGKPDVIAQVEYRSLVESDLLEGRGRWGPGSMSPRQEGTREGLARGNVCVALHYTRLALQEGDTASRTYRFIAAPKLDAVLEPYGDGMTKAVRFGVFPSLSRLLLGILKFFYRVIPNYGIAILLLTLVVKVALHPLTRKSQVGMHKMSLLSPKLAELRKKFGDDKQKMAQEQMGLFKRYGVHPMSGCLPMILQLPVFLSLFGTLRSAVELRQAMFIPGWVTDLSRPDTICHLPFYLPILGNEVNVLPFLMLVTWVLNQKFTPKPVDPQAQQQQQMMKWMPVVFTLMLYRLASGLLLYWTASSAFGILEQWLLRRSFAGMELKPVAEDEKKRKAKRPASASESQGFFGKLTDMVEEQRKRGEPARSKKPKKRP